MDYKQQQYNRYAQEQLPPQPNRQIVSQFRPLYDQLTNNIDLDVSGAIQSLERNGIHYLPMTRCEQFSYKVEKMLASYGFYRIHVKIAHFSLTLTAAKSTNNISSLVQSGRGSRSNIFFVEVNNKSLCLKGYSFKTQTEFQKMFSILLKELTILKICSAIRCSVNAQNFLGFDIIIDENMAYFATEKGTPITKLTIFQARQLREELRLMHEFKIIHFDIKAVNIVYSQHHRKPVFIDFGFSQIVKEEIGFRTLTHFRGTPNFCTAELLAIMSEVNGYVDVYYNDAFGLDLFIKESIKQNFTEDFLQRQDVNQVYKAQNCHSIQAQSSLSLLPFKFYYLNANYNKSKECMLMSLSVDDLSIKYILIFIRDIIPFARIEKLLIQDLAMYALLPQYIQIKEKMKILKEKFFFEVQEKQPSENNENIQQLYATSFEPISFSQFQYTNNFVCYKHYLKLIMSIQHMQDKLIKEIIAVIFSCIRFDVHNLGEKDKIIIAKKMNPLFYQYQQQQYEVCIQEQYKMLSDNTGIEDIRFLLSQILHFIFVARTINWAKENVFDLFEQMIILDMDCSVYADRLLRYIDQSYKTQEEHVLVCLELKRFCLTSNMLVSRHPEKIGAFLDKTYITIKRYQDSFESINHANSSLIRLVRLYNQAIHLQTSFRQLKVNDFLSSARNINDSKINDYISYHILDQLIAFTIAYGNVEDLLTIANKIKTSINIRSLDFMSYTRLSLNLICAANSCFDINNYCNYLERVINCPAISSKFKICKLKKRDAINHQSLSSSIGYVLQNYEYLSSISQNADSEILEIVLRIKTQNIVISKDLERQLLQVYKIYEKCMQSKLSSSKTRTNYFWFTFIRSQIEFFFFELSPDTNKTFLDNYCNSKNELDALQSDSTDDPLKLVYTNFKYLLYEYKLLQTDKRYEECFSCLLKLCSICQNLRLNYIALEMFKSLNHLSMICWNDQMLQRSVTQLFSFCRTINSYSFYLLPTSYNLLAKYSQQQFQQFVIRLTQFLTQHPLLTYFHIFVGILDRFLSKYPTGGHLFHYSKLQNHSSFDLTTNPYLIIFYVYSLHNEESILKQSLLKKIAINLDNLNNSAKKKLLEKYYYLDLVSSNHKRGSYVFRIAKQFCNKSRCRKYIKQCIKLPLRKTLVDPRIQQCFKEKKSCFINNY